MMPLYADLVLKNVSCMHVWVWQPWDVCSSFFDVPVDKHSSCMHQANYKRRPELGSCGPSGTSMPRWAAPIDKGPL